MTVEENQLCQSYWCNNEHKSPQIPLQNMQTHSLLLSLTLTIIPPVTDWCSNYCYHIKLPRESKKRKTGHPTYAHYFGKCWQISQFFHQWLSSKHVMNRSLRLPPHLKHITTLPLWNVNVRNLATIWKKCRINNQFKLYVLQLTTLGLLCVTVARMQVSRCEPLVSGTVSNIRFHSSPHNALEALCDYALYKSTFTLRYITLHQTLPRIIHILHFCLVDSLLNYATDFIVSWTKVRAVKNLEVHTGDHDLLDHCTVGVEAAMIQKC